MRLEANEHGRKFSYEHTVDADGYDMVTDIVYDETITVIDGVEYTIQANAPQPPVYGIRIDILALHEGAAEKATYDTYNYVTGEYGMGKNVPRYMVLDPRGPYEPPGQEVRLRTLMNGKPDMEWTKVDYMREINLGIQPSTDSTFPRYNYRPIVDDDTI